MDISRKRFIEALAGGSALLVLSGCGGGGSSYGGGNPAPSTSGCNEVISANHDHVLTIAVADLDSATPKTYDIRGAADHSHQVTFSVAQLKQLKAGTTVTVTSTVAEGHMHNATVNCVVM